MRSALKRRSTRIVAALTLLVLLGCTPLRCGYTGHDWNIGAGAGQVTCLWDSVIHHRGWFWVVVDDWPIVDGHTYLLPQMQSPTFFTLPLYLPALVLLIVLTWMLTRKAPPGPGHCRNCGYDLTGNTSGRCPECGASCGA